MPRNLSESERFLVIHALQHKAEFDRAQALAFGVTTGPNVRLIRQFQEQAVIGLRLALDIENAGSVSLKEDHLGGAAMTSPTVSLMMASKPSKLPADCVAYVAGYLKTQAYCGHVHADAYAAYLEWSKEPKFHNGEVRVERAMPEIAK